MLTARGGVKAPPTRTIAPTLADGDGTRGDRRRDSERAPEEPDVGERDEAATSGPAGEAGSLLAEQRRELARQDASLDQMSAALQRLGDIARDVSTEVGAQSRVIDGLDADVDTTRAAVDATTRRVNDLIRQNGGCAWATALLALSGIAFLLFLIILFG